MRTSNVVQYSIQKTYDTIVQDTGKYSRVTSKDCPVGLAIRKAKKLALGMELSKSEARKAAEVAAAEKEIRYLEEEAAGDGEKSDEGASSENVV